MLNQPRPVNLVRALLRHETRQARLKQDQVRLMSDLVDSLDDTAKVLRGLNRRLDRLESHLGRRR